MDKQFDKRIRRAQRRPESGNTHTEKSPGDLRRLPVIQTPAKNHQLKLMCKS